ncbi:glycosyltransferase [Salipaludibacillus keqinensis]|uniref:Glycosyltransferase n=1 Tax=Salipaludibacillus keqinensis TaxID=2045207 RepID=A0A323TTT2_9BACI|nr:glycosyltransferase family 8 protein [Salipaludibacillus keqinensis]PYZ92855.1 glycosyltransferase [Salipaludibacillus keqinensis]
MEEIHLVTAANNKYVEPLSVMLYSLLINKTSKIPLKIYIIASNLTLENKHNIIKLMQNFNSSIDFISIGHSKYNKLKTVGHLTKETYYRFSIPELLGEHIRKVLYLDCDLIIKDDITRLWNYDVNHYTLAAVENPGLTHRFKDLLIPEDSSYFNAGVLLINMEKWKQENTTNKLLKFIEKNQSKIKLCSQDPLNAVLHNKWLKLDPTWNYQVFRCSHLDINPSIIHFTTHKKPWKGYKPLFYEEYFNYLKELT